MLRAVLLVVALLPSVPVARLLLQRGVRRRLGGFPPRTKVAVAGAIVGIVIAIVAATFVLPLIAAAACGSLALLILDLNQRRASYGGKQRLPPGSLGFFSIAPWTDPDYYEKAATRYGNIFKFRHFTVPAVGVKGIERIAELLRTHERDLVVPPAPFNELVPSGFVRYLEGAHHDRIASVLRSALSPAVVAHYSSQMAGESLAALQSLASGAPIVDAAEKLTSRLMLLLFFGIEPPEQLRIQRLFEQADYRSLSETGKAKARLAVESIIDEMRVMAHDRGRISFLSQLVVHHPEALESDAVLGNLAYSLHTGRVDISGLLVWLSAVAAANPESMKKLRDTVASCPDEALTVGGLADRIVRETLRLHQSEFLMRRTKNAIEFGGYRIPAGWHVRLCIAESHRSADVFEHPTTFNPDRFLTPMSRATFAPFGFAPRACPGEHLARAIGRHFVAAAAQGFNLSVSGVQPWEFTGFHWKPNSRMKLEVAPLT